jgi:hypothetical protein
MKSIGLQPSSTGLVGGKQTDQRMRLLHHPRWRVRTGLSETRGDRLGAEPAIRTSARRYQGAERQQDKIHLSVMRLERLG